MSYRCSICDAVTANGHARYTHCVYRTVSDLASRKPRQEIAAEYPVCAGCKRQLLNGVSLSALVRGAVANETLDGGSVPHADTPPPSFNRPVTLKGA